MTISALARRKGVVRQAISKRVAKLEAEGLISTRPGPNGTKLVNIVAFDRAVGQVGEPAKEAAAATKRALASPAEDAGELRDPRYRNAKAADAHYAAELKRLELEERLGKLVRVDDVADAIGQAARTIRAVIERLPLRAAELAAAVGKDGEVGARGALRAAAHEELKAIADALEALAAPPIDGTMQ